MTAKRTNKRNLRGRMRVVASPAKRRTAATTVAARTATKGSTRNADQRLLHVHGQYSPRGPVAIVGNRCALVALRNAVDSALATGYARFEARVGDGQSCTVGIQCDNSEVLWPQRALPYSALYAEEKRDDAIWPDLLSP